MNKKIFLVVGIVVALLVLGLFLMRGESSLESSRDVASSWVENDAPTYIYDGFNLQLQEEEELIKDSKYRFVFTFNSRGGGYGDRTDQIVTQAITPHVIEVIVENRVVVEAITDNIFSELDGELLINGVEYNDIDVPVIETTAINLYFGHTSGEDTRVVRREVSLTPAMARTALEELIKGPNAQELEEGYFSSVNSNTRIQRLEIQDGVAYADFSQELQLDIGGSAMVTFIRAQIEDTLMQFPTVDEVVISIDGSIDDILQP